MACGRWIVSQALDLRLAELGLLGGVPADRRGVEEDLGALQGRQPGGLGIPLVPANERADPGVRGLERLEAQVAGREVILLVIERVVGNVHLAVAAAERAVGVEDDRRVVVDPGRAALEDRADHDHARLARDRASASVVGPGIGSARSNRAASSTWQKYWVRNSSGRQATCAPPLGRLAQHRAGPAQVVVRVVRASHLDQADGERAGCMAHQVVARIPSRSRDGGIATLRS